MKRDLDLIRAILLLTEAEAPPMGVVKVTPQALSPFYEKQIDDRTIFEHVMLMEKDGMFARIANSFSGAAVGNLSMRGYDFLDSIRDPEIWTKTKNAAASAKAFTLELLGDIAKGLVKTQIKNLTGVEI